MAKRGGTKLSFLQRIHALRPFEFLQTQVEVLPKLGLKLPTSFNERLDRMRTDIPTTISDVREWMQIAGVENELLWAMADDYANAGGEILSLSGDPYIPGVAVADYKIVAVPLAQAQSEGMRITKNGALMATIPLDSKGWTNDKLTIGMFPRLGEAVQWIGNLFHYRQFAKLPNSAIVTLPGIISQNGTPLSPSAVYSFNLVRPSMQQTIQFDAQAPVESKAKVHIWDTSKNTIVSSQEATIPGSAAGDGSRLSFTFVGFAPKRGFIEIEPTNAPSGMSVANIITRPMSV